MDMGHGKSIPAVGVDVDLLSLCQLQSLSRSYQLCSLSPGSLWQAAGPDDFFIIYNRCPCHPLTFNHVASAICVPVHSPWSWVVL